MSLTRAALLRLGLYQLGAGAVSVLLLGVLNRVLRVEMGFDLLLVGVILGGGHYLGALVAIPLGYLSDRHALRGLHRTPYILGGITVVCLALAASPFVAQALAASSDALPAAAGFLFFLLEGIGTYVAGTAYLALLTDLTEEGERGRAVALVWTLLLVGILIAVVYIAITLADYSFDALRLSFLGAAAGVFGLALTALARQERPSTAPRSSHDRSLVESVATLAESPQTRLFFAFLVVGLFATFMQDIVLEPFGGEVLGLSVRETSMFNAYQIVGTIGAMWFGGSWLIPRRGKAWVTSLGAFMQAAGFVLLSMISLLELAWAAPPIVLLIGTGMGFFTVGGVALMMDMTLTGQTGLFVGAWTLAQAMARGPASIAASGLHNAARLLGAGPGGAYASVFLIEAAGLVLAVWLLRQIGVRGFRSEAAELGAVATHAMD